jgi:hypothetical protein
MKQTTETETETTTEPKSHTPFVVRKTSDAPRVVRTGVRAGTAEQRRK